MERRLIISKRSWAAALLAAMIIGKLAYSRQTHGKVRSLQELSDSRNPAERLGGWRKPAEIAPTPEPSSAAASAPRSDSTTWTGPGKIEGQVSEGHFRLTFNDADWFAPGTARLTGEGLTAAGNLAGALKRLPMNWKKASFRIEGHSDSSPVVRHADMWPTNWELSGARAFALVRVLEIHGFGREQLAGVGYADSRPVTAGGPAERRIVVEISAPTAAEPTINLAEH